MSADHIVQAALVELYRRGSINEQEMREQTAPLGIDPDKVDPAAR